MASLCDEGWEFKNFFDAVDVNARFTVSEFLENVLCAGEAR